MSAARGTKNEKRCMKDIKKISKKKKDGLSIRASTEKKRAHREKTTIPRPMTGTFSHLLIERSEAIFEYKRRRLFHLPTTPKSSAQHFPYINNFASHCLSFLRLCIFYIRSYLHSLDVDELLGKEVHEE